MNGNKDWEQWHQYYDDEASSQSKRLRLVREEIAHSLPDNLYDEIHVIDICAGDGRDLLPVVAGYSSRDNVTAMLVERNQQLANEAAAMASKLGLNNINVLNSDASLSTTYEQAVPADLVMLCGVFGNIRTQDIETMIDTLPQLLRRGGRVIWTINLRGPILSESILRYFATKDFELISSRKTDDNSYVVGVCEFRGNHETLVPGKSLFTFVK